MKLPEKIKGRNRVRDLAICARYLPPYSMSQESLGKKFNLTEQRVGQILKANATLLKTSKDWESVQDIRRLNAMLVNKDTTSKDPVDLILAKHKILEENKTLVDQSTHITQITYGWKNSSHRDSLRTPGISSDNSRVSGEV